MLPIIKIILDFVLTNSKGEKFVVCLGALCAVSYSLQALELRFAKCFIFTSIGGNEVHFINRSYHAYTSNNVSRNFFAGVEIVPPYTSPLFTGTLI